MLQHPNFLTSFYSHKIKMKCKLHRINLFGYEDKANHTVIGHLIVTGQWGYITLW